MTLRRESRSDRPHLRRRVAGHAPRSGRVGGGRSRDRGRAVHIYILRSGASARRRAPRVAERQGCDLEMLTTPRPSTAASADHRSTRAGLEQLSAIDRHVIAKNGRRARRTTSVFPSDDEVRRFLASEGREADWREMPRRPGRDLRAHRRDPTSPPSSRSSRAPRARATYVPCREVCRTRRVPGRHRVIGQPGPPRLRRPGDEW